MEQALDRAERAIPYRVMLLLFELWESRCAYCGMGVIQGDHDIDHCEPVTRGGRTVLANLVLACQTCNRSKGARTAHEYGHPDVAARAELFAHSLIVLNRAPDLVKRIEIPWT